MPKTSEFETQAKLIEAIRAERDPVQPDTSSAADLIREDRGA